MPPVFLGLDEQGVACFAQDISAVQDPNHELVLCAGLSFQESRSAAMALHGPETGILAQAGAQIGWHQRHQFYSVCGERTRQLSARSGQRAAGAHRHVLGAGGLH